MYYKERPSSTLYISRKTRTTALKHKKVDMRVLIKDHFNEHISSGTRFSSVAVLLYRHQSDTVITIRNTLAVQKRTNGLKKSSVII